MLTNLYLHNYKSFGDVEFSLKGHNNITKKFAVIYGENGSGKSNIISAISFLKSSMNTLTIQNKLNYFILNRDNDEIDNSISNYFNNSYVALDKLIKNTKTIGSRDNMKIKYEFIAKDKNVIYEMEFNDKDIVAESLSFPLGKNMTEVYRIKNGQISINAKLFLNKMYEREIINKIQRYFGQHTFLGILVNEIEITNKKFLVNSLINNNFLTILHEIGTCSILCKNEKIVEHFLVYDTNILQKLQEGLIKRNVENINLIKKTQRILTDYFSPLYSDIKRVEYKYEIDENGNIKYELYFHKMINGKIRAIPYYLESTGTNKVLEMFPYIYGCIKGYTVFIDEIDSGIHDLLMVDIIKNLIKQSKGQLVITTHNTLLLDEMNADNVYVINVDHQGNKKIECIKNFGRIQNNHSLTNRYLKGFYGGTPITGYINFDDMIDEDYDDD